MKEYLLVIIITWVVRSIADLGVKYSKTTENTIDDILFNNFKKLIDTFNFKIKNK